MSDSVSKAETNQDNNGNPDITKPQSDANNHLLLPPPPAFEDVAVSPTMKSTESSATLKCIDEESFNPNSSFNSSVAINSPQVSRTPGTSSSLSSTGVTNPAFDGNLDEKTPSKNFDDFPLKNGNNKVVKVPKEEKQYTGIKRYGGMLFTLFASFCFSMVVLFVKKLNNDYDFDAYGSSFWRYAGTALPTIPILLIAEIRARQKTSYDTEKLDFPNEPVSSTKKSVFDSVWPLTKNENWKQWIGLFSRGLIGSTSVILRYYALQYLTIADTSVITYSTPVLVTVMAHFFLGEKCGVVPIIVAFTTLVGVGIVTKPPLLTGAESFDTNTLIGTGLALGSLFCASLIVVITRKIREVHFAVMTLVFGLIGVAQAYIMAKSFGGDLSIPQGLGDSLLTLGVAGLSFLGQMSIVLALKFEQAGPVALIRSCDVIFGFLLQYIFLNEIPDAWSAVGGAIVLSCVLTIGLRKWMSTLPDSHRMRRSFGFLLR